METIFKSHKVEIHAKNEKRTGELETEIVTNWVSLPTTPVLSSEKDKMSWKKVLPFSKMLKKTNRIFTISKINLKQLTTQARTEQGGR